MFETEGFKTALTLIVSEETTKTGLKTYESGIIDYLQTLASENEKDLMEKELRKPTTERRGVSTALQSARELVKEGAKFAAMEKRELLTVADITTAYKVKFCSVWPFCK